MPIAARGATDAGAAPHPFLTVWRRAGLVYLVVGFVLLMLLAIHNGLPVSSALRALLVILGAQVIPGAVLWRAVRPRRGWLIEDAAMGFACGYVLSVIGQTIAGLAHTGALSVAPAACAVGALLSLPASRHRVLNARCEPLPNRLGAIATLALIPAAINVWSYFHHDPVGRYAGYRAPQVDQYFQLGLIQQLKLRGPGAWPFVDGVGLDYQWFAHAWMAQISSLGQVSPPLVLFRIAPIITIFAAVASVISVTLRLGGSTRSAALAVVLTMLSGYANFWHASSAGLPFNPESPTLGASVPVLLALVSVLAMHWRSEDIRLPAVLIIVLSIAAAATKGSSTPLVIAGTALALIALAAARQRAARIIAADLVIMCVALVVTMKVIFHGSAAGLTFAPRLALASTWAATAVGRHPDLGWLLLGAVTLFGASFSRAALGFWALCRRGSWMGRSDPVLWLLLGATTAGAIAPMLFVQPGSSQYYFRISAIPLAAIASGLAAEPLLDRFGSSVRTLGAGALLTGVGAYFLPMGVLGAQRHDALTVLSVLGVGAAFVAASLASGYAIARKSGALASACGVGLVSGITASIAALVTTPVAPMSPARATQPGAMSYGQIVAAQYIGTHAGPHDLVMTDRHCRTPDPGPYGCDNRWFLVGGASGRQVLIEGWGYAPPIMRAYPKGRTSNYAPFWNQHLLSLNDSFYLRPTAAAARALWNRGVRWVYVDKLMPHASTFAPFAAMRYENGQAAVWQLQPLEHPQA